MATKRRWYRPIVEGRYRILPGKGGHQVYELVNGGWKRIHDLDQIAAVWRIIAMKRSSPAPIASDEAGT